jgi:hypothetical protein
MHPLPSGGYVLQQACPVFSHPLEIRGNPVVVMTTELPRGQSYFYVRHYLGASSKISLTSLFPREVQSYSDIFEPLIHISKYSDALKH